MSERLEEMLAKAERDAGVTHADGVRWHEAPLPRRWHRCWTQTSGWVGLTQVARCACGAVNRNGEGWFDRNSRRKGTRHG